MLASVAVDDETPQHRPLAALAAALHPILGSERARSTRGERHDGDDSVGQGRVEPRRRTEALLPSGGDGRAAALRRRAAHRQRAGWLSRRSSTPVRRHGACGVRSPKSTGTRASSMSWPRAACARAATTSSGWSRTARRWPARPDCWTCGVGRSGACRPHVVSAGTCCAVAAWRGAFLAHGSLTEPGRSCALEITCPGPESALALVGAARRIGVGAKAREVRGVDRVVVKDGDAIAALLTRIGAHASVLYWEERRVRREVRATANRLANFDDANLRRSARAAVAAAARVTRALEILERGRARAPDQRPAGCGWSTSRRPWRSWARWPIPR